MGDGTAVAQEAGDVVILNNSLTSIKDCVLNSRTMSKSVGKFLIFQLTVNISTLLMNIIAPILGWTEPFSIVQILWINLIMDTLAAMAFGGEPILDRYMNEKPALRKDNILTTYIKSAIGTSSVFITLGSILILENIGGITDFVTPAGCADPELYEKTFMFAFFIYSIIFNSLNTRSERFNVFEHIEENKNFIIVMGVIFILQTIIIEIGGQVFSTTTLNAKALFVSMLLAVLIIPVEYGKKSHCFEKMIAFHTDLDNTLIYSYKHDIGPQKRNVELYQGREISYITEETYHLLQLVKNEMLIVPTTTRTLEQYQRIDLGIGPFPYALVCNGGVLLVNGVPDEAWYQDSLHLVSDSREEMNLAMELLEREPRRKFELRYIEKLFIFTKCNDPETVVNDLKTSLDTKYVDVFSNGEKVYVVPQTLNKGTAVDRLREKLKPEFVIAAGDSTFDIPMLLTADRGLVPSGFTQKYEIPKTSGARKKIDEMTSKKIFSDALLEKVLKIKTESVAAGIIHTG